MNKTLWIMIVAAVVIALGWWFLSLQTAKAPETLGEVQGARGEQFVDTSSKDGAALQPVSAYTVRYTDRGFEPATLTVPAGTTVTFVNESAGEMWVGSDQHPSHTGYDGTAKDEHCATGYAGAKPFDECGAGAAYSFTFTKAGTYGYHNHRNDDDRGTVVVQ